MTLKEIAQEAGVSISTVSRVINQGNSNVASKEVQNRIWEIVRRTGYIPNSNARNLKNGMTSVMTEPSRSIACLFARTPDAITDPFFSIWPIVSRKRLSSRIILLLLIFRIRLPFI